MSPEDAAEPVPPDASSHFARLAARFCALLDRRDQLERRELLEEAHELVAQLYGAALALPPTRPSRPVRRRAQAPGEDARTRLRETAALIGPRRDAYRQCFDPYNLDEDPLPSSLAEDLCGVYADLADGLAHWDAGEADDAVWAWRFSFGSHWGEHASAALRALYWLACRHGIGPARQAEPA